jgi:hypothetical protein
MSALSQRDAAAQPDTAGAARTGEREDAGRALLDHAARLLAAAKALEATAAAPGAAPAVGPTLACMEASLGALTQSSERLREHALQLTTSSSVDHRLQRRRSENIRRFARLSAALDEARAACAATRRDEQDAPSIHWLGP